MSLKIGFVVFFVLHSLSSIVLADSATKTSQSQTSGKGAMDPFLGIDKDLLAEEEALLAKVKVVPKAEVANNAKVTVIKADADKEIKPVKADVRINKSQAKVLAQKKPVVQNTNTQTAEPKTAAVTQVENTRAIQLEGELSALQAELRVERVRAHELSAELARTKDQLMLSETEVERLSKILDTRREEKLAALSGRPVNSQSSSNNSNAESRMAVGPSGALSANSRNFASSATNPTLSQSVGDMPVATVIADKAYLRTGPGRENSPLMSVKNGTKLAIEVREGEWYRVTSPTGDRAWIAADVVAFNGASSASPVKSTVRVLGYDRSLEQQVVHDEDKAFELINRR